MYFNSFRQDDFTVRACVPPDDKNFKNTIEGCGIELEDFPEIELKDGCACSTDLCNTTPPLTTATATTNTTQKTKEVQPPAIQQGLATVGNFSTFGARIYNELLAFGILILLPFLNFKM